MLRHGYAHPGADAHGYARPTHGYSCAVHGYADADSHGQAISVANVYNRITHTD
jgi:hypothetical protein